MSENNAQIATDNSVDANPKEVSEESPAKRGRKSGKRVSTLARAAQEGEAILKGMGHKEDGAAAPEGRRTTRSSTRGSIATPPPAKKEKKTPAPKGRGRGRGKKVEEEEEEEETKEEAGGDKKGEDGANGEEHANDKEGDKEKTNNEEKVQDDSREKDESAGSDSKKEDDSSSKKDDASGGADDSKKNAEGDAVVAVAEAQ